MQDRLETIVFVASHIGTDIDHHSGQMLASAGPHASRFLKPHLKTLVQDQGTNLNQKAIHGVRNSEPPEKARSSA